ncbi:MAG: 3-dehydroquinate synthase [Flavobacteriales bacterium]|jgi:3-dehydroquinate synthase|nr:3-dehydroquinate synthase [Flavobacteriales bacterium]
MEFLENGYPIYTGISIDNAYQAFSQIYPKEYSKILILVDKRAKIHCLSKFLSFSSLNNYELLEMEGGEKHKTLETCTLLWEKMTQLKIDRKALLVNLGGGVVTDLGGFVASTYKRGIDFINIPTTVLSQVDASVGSKVGINFQGYKNQLGAFSDPKAVIIDERYLKTLDKRNILNGYAEIYKHGLIADAKYFDDTINERLSWEEILRKSIEIKSHIVQQDKKESGIRKSLNFGHTFAHAIETLAHKKQIDILHGEAVILGLYAECFLSAQFYKNEMIDLEFLLQKYHSYKHINLINSELIPFIQQDKKNHNNKCNFVLIKSIGSCTIDIPIDQTRILDTINYLKKLLCKLR